MTNIAKAIDRLREERREAQNQVQKLLSLLAVSAGQLANDISDKRLGVSK